MDKRQAVSPEWNANDTKHGSIPRRTAASVKSRLRYRYLLKKWAPHGDPRSLGWNWSDTNYNRIALVNLLLGKFQDPAYLEIGCADNALFDSLPARNKVGVDPSSGGNVRATSDEFFSKNTSQFDVVFIDGMHTYEQVRRDVVNSLACVREGGWIALHDMLPRNWVEGHVPGLGRGAWTGDVWKVAFELSQTPGLDFKLLRIDHGCGVARVLESGAELKNLTGELLDSEFSYYYEHLNDLPIIEWDEAEDWLRL